MSTCPPCRRSRSARPTGGTRVTYRSEGTAKTLVGRVAEPLLTYLTHRDAWASLDRLEQLLEGPQSRA